ncbi:MAG: exonuclease SbcCD subunit D [Acidimicrobiia bacterium]
MARILHTSDWHVGKGIRGRSRADEHRAVLAEIAGLAAEHRVDLVVVAGDVFDTAAPKPDAEEIAYRALLDLADAGAQVAVISGNHDSAQRLRAVGPLLGRAGVHVLTEPTRPDAGGVRRVELAGGEALELVLLPFVSQRGIVRADQLMHDAAHEHAQAYAERLAGLVGLLCADLDPALPAVLASHSFVLGARAGGGERAAHLVEEYAVPATCFPATVGYVALGHLHRAQKLPGATQIHYCGSPLQLDFGEAAEAKQVNLVEVAAGRPAKVTPIPLRQGAPLHTLVGTLDAIVDAAGPLPEAAWLRARVDEPRRAGLADDLRHALGPRADRLVDVQVLGTPDEQRADRPTVEGRSPRDLFGEFLAARGIDDPKLAALFDRLHDEAAGAGSDEQDAA